MEPKMKVLKVCLLMRIDKYWNKCNTSNIAGVMTVQQLTQYIHDKRDFLPNIISQSSTNRRTPAIDLTFK